MFYPGTLVCPCLSLKCCLCLYFRCILFLKCVHFACNSGCFPPVFFLWVNSPCIAHLLVSPSKCMTSVLSGSFGVFVLQSSGHTVTQVFSCNTPVPTKHLNFGLSARAISADLLHDLSTKSKVVPTVESRSIPNHLHLLSPNYMIVPLFGTTGYYRGGV